MKYSIPLTTMLMLTGLAWSAESEQRIGDFSLLDQNGNVHQMSRYSNRRGIVLLTGTSECPMPPEIAAAYSQIKLTVVDLGFEFMVLSSSRSTEHGRVSRELIQLGLDLPVLQDDTRRVSASLGVRKTGEVIVFDPKSLTVIYRGSADHILELALFSILAGEEVMNSIDNSPGCEIDYEE